MPWFWDIICCWFIPTLDAAWDVIWSGAVSLKLATTDQQTYGGRDKIKMIKVTIRSWLFQLNITTSLQWENDQVIQQGKIVTSLGEAEKFWVLNSDFFFVLWVCAVKKRFINWNSHWVRPDHVIQAERTQSIFFSRLAVGSVGPTCQQKAVATQIKLFDQGFHCDHVAPTSIWSKEI